MAQSTLITSATLITAQVDELGELVTLDKAVVQEIAIVAYIEELAIYAD